MPTAKEIRGAAITLICRNSKSSGGLKQKIAGTTAHIYAFLKQNAPQDTPADFEVFRDAAFNFLEGKPVEIPENVYKWVEYYFKGFYIMPTYKQARELIKAICAYKEDLRGVAERTAADRSMLRHYGVFTVADRIRDFIRYYNEIKKRDTLLLYTDLYYMGYIDGKRAERKRRAEK